MRERYLSPRSGVPLWQDAPYSLACPGERWPVVDSIPYLRTGREDLVAAVLARLDGGDPGEALVLLLADQDDWWDGPPPSGGDLRALVRDRDRLTLREAMAGLAYGRVGHYFAHRWSDPTFLAGLALLEAHWTAPSCAFELACGIGHYGRELQLRGVRTAGGDVVYSKLWLARHWVVGGAAELVCFDAAAPWPLVDRAFDLVACQDAFYFLEPKAEILARLRALGAAGSLLAIGHIHNREAANMSAGAGVTADEVASLLPDGLVYDDDELTRAAIEARAPRPAPPHTLRSVEAFSVAAGPGLGAPAAVGTGIVLPPAGTSLRRNPLYAAEGGRALAWPSERYGREYGRRTTFPCETHAPESAVMSAGFAEAARRRELVALPERW